MDLRTCYQILELRPGVSTTELRQTYRDLVQVWHPDRFSHNPRLQRKAEAKLSQINQAYEILDTVSASLPQQRPVPVPNRGKSRRHSPLKGCITAMLMLLGLLGLLLIPFFSAYLISLQPTLVVLPIAGLMAILGYQRWGRRSF